MTRSVQHCQGVTLARSLIDSLHDREGGGRFAHGRHIGCSTLGSPDNWLSRHVSGFLFLFCVIICIVVALTSVSFCICSVHAHCASHSQHSNACPAFRFLSHSRFPYSHPVLTMPTLVCTAGARRPTFPRTLYQDDNGRLNFPRYAALLLDCLSQVELAEVTRTISTGYAGHTAWEMFVETVVIPANRPNMRTREPLLNTRTHLRHFLNGYILARWHPLTNGNQPEGLPPARSTRWNGKRAWPRGYNGSRSLAPTRTRSFSVQVGGIRWTLVAPHL